MHNFQIPTTLNFPGVTKIHTVTKAIMFNIQTVDVFMIHNTEFHHHH